jgi:hypothetical protein
VIPKRMSSAIHPDALRLNGGASSIIQIELTARHLPAFRYGVQGDTS